LRFPSHGWFWVFDRVLSLKGRFGMEKYDLWRDVPNNLWLLKDKQGNILKKSPDLEKIENFVKMKKKLEKNKK
jgi:hypothetical protein